MKTYRIFQSVLSVLLLSVTILFAACEEMDDNYKDYLEDIVYSPRVTGLSAQNGYQVVTLNWDNPKGDIAQKIIIRYDEEELVFDEMVSSAVISNLEVKGYEMAVYTMDGAGNYSVPAMIYVFPNGEDTPDK